MDAIIVDLTVYIPRSERGAYGRDVTHRPFRMAEDAPGREDVWTTPRDSEHPSAVTYRAASLPYVKIMRWNSTGTFTVYREHDGIRASMDASTWDHALDAAYAYAAWDDASYAI